MISLGEKLGARWFVTQTPASQTPGTLFEVRDAQGQVYAGQILVDAPLDEAATATLRAELEKVPRRSGVLLLPKEIVRSSAGWPVALYTESPPPSFLASLRSLETGGVESRRVEALRTLQRWFVAFARGLERLHLGGIMHGAITPTHLHLVSGDDGELLTLSGFGLGRAAHLAGRRGPLTVRDDLVGTLGAMIDALDATRATPDAGALARWELLKRCMRGGEHIALESGRNLAASFETLHAIPPPRRPDARIPPSPGASTLTPASGSPAGTSADPALSNSGSGASPQGIAPAPPAAKPAFKPPPAPSIVPPAVRSRRLVVLGVGGLALIALGIGGALYLNQTPSPAEAPVANVRVRVRSTPSQCDREPTTVALPTAAVSLTARCLDGDATTLGVFAHAGGVAHFVSRPSTLGATFSRALTTVSEQVTELGTALAEDGLWLSWRPSEGAAFAIAKVTPTLARVALTSPGWRPDDFRGAFLLRASTAQSWVASTLGEGPSAQVVVAQFDASPGSATPFTVFVAAPGTLLAASAGDPATLLVRSPEGRQVSLLSVPLRALSGIAESPIARSALTAPTPPADAAPPSDAAAMPEGPTVRRISASAVVVRGQLAITGSVSAAPEVVVGSNGGGLVALSEGTDSPQGVRGRVRFVTFSPSGAPESTPIEGLSEGARAVGLVPGREGVEALIEAGGTLSLVSLAPGGTPRVLRSAEASTGALALAHCGDATFVVRSPSEPSPTIAATRSPCRLRE